MTDKKFRLVTRADFDGIVCGSLLMELDLIDDVLFAEPKDMQDGVVPVSGRDITANLPYREEVHLCFDHHVSELTRVGKQGNHVIDPKAPSTARVIYEYYGGSARFPLIGADMMDAVDKADSAQYEEGDILAPTGWTLLNFIMDPRTGLARFKNFRVPNEEMMKDLMVYCRRHSLREILELPDIVERVHTYIEHDEASEHQLRRCSRMEGHVAVTDLRNEPVIYACNRFMVYAMNPGAKVSIQVTREENDGPRTILAVGKSILDRSSKTEVGPLMLEYGGGGHAGAGTCRVPHADADRVLAELIERINADG
jgi:nanoRNase/pAp phosphatase (c-di-AMP/oligoRNAs hydrolase)